MHLRNAGKTSPPIEYTVFNYRKMFNLSPQQFREDVLLSDFIKDLELMELEYEHQKWLEENPEQK